MVLQYAEDGTLREYLMANFTKLQWTDKLRIAKEIAFGLLFLHNNDIIHRDLVSTIDVTGFITFVFIQSLIYYCNPAFEEYINSSKRSKNRGFWPIEADK